MKSSENLGDRGHGHASFATLIRATDRSQDGPTGRGVATPEVNGVVLGFLCSDQLLACLEHDRRKTLQIPQSWPGRQLGEGTHPLRDGLEQGFRFFQPLGVSEHPLCRLGPRVAQPVEVSLNMA